MDEQQRPLVLMRKMRKRLDEWNWMLKGIDHRSLRRTVDRSQLLKERAMILHFHSACDLEPCPEEVEVYYLRLLSRLY